MVALDRVAEPFSGFIKPSRRNGRTVAVLPEREEGRHIVR